MTFCHGYGSALQSSLNNQRRTVMATASIRLDADLVEKASIMAKALNRTTPKQIEHWAKIGEMMEDNPNLPYEFVKQVIIARAEKEAVKLEAYNFDYGKQGTSNTKFQKAVKKLHKNQKQDLDKAIKLIVAEPKLGEQKKGDLAFMRVYKFNMVKQLTLLGYSYEDGANVLELIALGSHENFCRDVKHLF